MTFFLMTMQETLAETACMMRESELKMKYVQTWLMGFFHAQGQYVHSQKKTRTLNSELGCQEFFSIFRFITGPTELDDVPIPRTPPKIFVNTDSEQEELILVVYKVQSMGWCQNGVENKLLIWETCCLLVNGLWTRLPVQKIKL